MYGFEAHIDFDIIDAIQDGARQFPTVMNTAVKRNLTRYKRRVLRVLREEPPEVTDANYPLRWKSPRQRRFVMAKLRRENNLPYERTHELVNAWDLTLKIDKNGGTFEFVNDRPEYDFVIGDNQQPFLIDIGWESAAPKLVQAEEELNELLIDTYLAIVL